LRRGGVIRHDFPDTGSSHAGTPPDTPPKRNIRLRSPPCCGTAAFGAKRQTSTFGGPGAAAPRPPWQRAKAIAPTAPKPDAAKLTLRCQVRLPRPAK
jgi:hypothetical protein